MYSLTYLLTCPKKSSTSHGFFHMVPLVPPAILAHMAPAGFTATEMPGNWFSLSKSKSRLAMKIDWVGGALCQPAMVLAMLELVYKRL